MQRLPLESSDLVSAGYDELGRVLEIEFKENRIYQYFDVPKDIYKGLIRADSPGRYFFSHINAYFRYRKVETNNKFSFSNTRTVTFVTGNQRKLREMQKACAPFGITVKHQAFDIDEIQAHEPMKIAEHKAAEAFKRSGGVPTVTHDEFWSIPALNGFPGGYMKDVLQWFSAEDFMHLMQGKADRRVLTTDTLTYKDARQTKVFTKITQGFIAPEPRGKGNSLEQVIIFAGTDKTIAELREQTEQANTPKEEIWHDFAAWFHDKEA